MTVKLRVMRSTNPKWPLHSFVTILRGGYGGSHLAVCSEEDATEYKDADTARTAVEAQVTQPENVVIQPVAV